jgi:hypothetical protein
MYHANYQELGSEVAIMGLQEKLAGGKDRVARLQVQSKLLSFLNHPDIECCIKRFV